MRILGSPDLYPREKRGDNASVNFITCHDGFTLYDLYSYNQKHNEDNGWENTDGANDNRSWNCGEEGDTQNPEILRLRRQLMKNACAVLMCSRGTPMFLAGDEFGNTQFGNNNPYCQDNEISWLNWEQLKDNEEIFEFFKFMIHFRKDHTILRKDTSPSSSGFPFLSLHGTEPWQEEYGPDTRTIGIMFAGQEEDGREDILYLGINAWWEQVQIELPGFPGILLGTHYRYFQRQRGCDQRRGASGSEPLCHESQKCLYLYRKTVIKKKKESLARDQGFSRSRAEAFLLFFSQQMIT